MVLKDLSEANPEIITVQISDIARGGKGVAREENGRVVFVPFTAPGDVVRVWVTERNKRYLDAQAIEIIKASSLRCTPPCPVFTKCGGCQWQHLPYQLQWEKKNGGVKHALQRMGISPPEDWEEHPADNQYHYRNRVQLRGFKEDLGFFAARSHTIIPISVCPIAKEEINLAFDKIRSEATKFTEAYKVEITTSEIGGVTYLYNSPHATGGFRQVNDEQNNKLRQLVFKEVPPNVELFDLFGGNGNLSLALADTVSAIHCVDVFAPTEVTSSLPSNYFFHRCSVHSWLLKQAAENEPLKKHRVAILDPPRIGLGETFNRVASSLEHLGVTKIITIGCDPDSWVKDVSRFVRRGWIFRKAALFDFFPQTPHVESVAILSI